MMKKLEIKIKTFLKRHGLFKLQNDTIFDLNRDYLKFLKIKKKYAKNLTAKYELTAESKKSNKVWICWLQGMDNAPPLVKACYESVKKHVEIGGWQVIVVTNDNFSDYVKFPDFIMEKYKKGIISRTHFSDLLRLELLINHGGAWIDSTCLLTDNIPDYVKDSDFFVFRNDYRGNLSSNLSNWFIYSVSNHPLLLHTRELLHNHWKYEKKLRHYFIFHFFTTMIMEKYPNLVESIPFVSNINPHVLQFEYLFRKFDKNSWEHIKRTCFIHKLSYKFDLTKYDIGKGETFYEKIVAGECK